MRTDTKWAPAAFLLAGCGVTNADFDDLEARVSALEQENAELRAALDAAVTAEDLDDLATLEDLEDCATLADLEDCATQEDLGDYATLSDLDALDTRVAAVEENHVPLIRGVVQINVPSDHRTLADALDWLGERRIASDGKVTISLANGTYSTSDSIWFQHPDGDRIRIKGNTSDPSQVVLEYTGLGTALVVTANNVVGSFDGVTLRAGGNANTQATGIQVSYGGVFVCGPNVVVEGFGKDGFQALYGGIIQAASTSAVDNLLDGFAAFGGGFIVAPYATSVGNDRGFAAEHSSFVDARHATATSNTIGVASTWGSAVHAHDAAVSGNTTDYLPAATAEDSAVVFDDD